MELKRAYARIWHDGSWYHSAQEFQSALTSRELKIQKKEANIAGLQLADLLAAPAKLDILVRNTIPVLSPPSGYTSKILNTIRPKINPWGRVFLG